MIGDQSDINARLRQLLPSGWFDDSEETSRVLSAVLSGASWVLAFVFSLIAFAKLQTRLATMTGGWLDLAANDFFGSNLPRLDGEADTQYSPRIRKEVFRDRNTRRAVSLAAFDISGDHPAIFEGFHAAECGGYGTTGLGYGVAGLYGSRGAPFESIVTLPYPENYGIPNRGGWGSSVGGYGAGNFSYVDETLMQGGNVSLPDIVAAIDRVKAAGTTIYVRFVQRYGAPE